MASPIVVFGASGFVGSACCRALLASGWPTTATSRSGAARYPDESWSSQARWVKAGFPESPPAQSELEGSYSAISCIGQLGAGAAAETACGDANVAAAEAAKEAGMSRFVLISAHRYSGLPRYALPGYFRGKDKAEAAVERLFPEAGVILRPTFVYGGRKVMGGSMTLPLQVLGRPADTLFSSTSAARLRGFAPQPVSELFEPPISVDEVAKAAVRCATDPSVLPGAVDVRRIRELSS